ncbi:MULTISPECIES: cytochrome c oxidase subunit 4 [Tsukamurella]|uniref:Cytochrome c oxidase polypeptide 4 n=1 Tax=Tsukamurella strandjordii TaxID=147577 RepID=A0AA90NRM2_9ACTN|nr:MULTISPECIES: cytochrome c oxidase subunit 4 [Tsukamurella]MDP0399529.1 cytochrome c oxidase subunit 4 [Tsukamurella strandjordii]GIZ95704.1 cytochrome c oxidase polypeptide 4 [Tsukamurella sp. TY48]
MKVEAKLFEWLTVFFFAVGILYTVVTYIWGTGHDGGGVEWVGTTGMFLTGGLTLITGTYFRFVANRVDTRPEDYEDAEVSDGAGELGFFSPHSWWPILLSASVAVVGISVALQLYWLWAFGGFLVVAAAWGLVFEYHKGPEKH